MSVLDGPGEGTWSVFALKVVEERDELRHKLAGEAAHIKSLEDLLVDAKRECAKAHRELGEILAVIHRDGGHHTGEHGITQSVADAHATWAAMVQERDEARQQLADEKLESASWRATARDKGASAREVAKERDELQALLSLTRAEVVARIRERDEARSELTLMRALGPKAHEAQRQRDENAALVESLRGELEEAQAQIKALQGLELSESWERDDLRAEIARMKTEEKQGIQDYLDLRDVADRLIAERGRALYERDKFRYDYESLEQDAAQAVLAYLHEDKAKLDKALRLLMENGRPRWWEPYRDSADDTLKKVPE